MIRENAFRFLGPVLGLAVGFALVFLVVPLVTGTRLDIPPEIGIPVFAGAFLLAVGAIVAGLLIGRTMVGDRIEIAMSEDGEKWRHGRLSIEPGRLVFQPYWWQVRVPSGTSQELDVDELGPDTGRRPPLRKIWSLNPQLHIVTLRASGRDLQIAALPSHLRKLRSRLDPSDAGTPADDTD